MPLTYQPRPRAVLICDFRGFEPPEMVKRRPVVVLASNPRNRRLVTVVPLSTTPPRRRRVWHHVISQPLRPLTESSVVWAKCDMVYTVSTARLSRIRNAGAMYPQLSVGAADYSAIVRSVLAGLGLNATDGQGP